MAIDLEKRTPKAATVASASNNIPIAYAFGNVGSLIFSSVANARHLAVINFAETGLAIAFSTGSATANPTQDDGYCPPAPSGSYSVTVLDDVQVNGAVFIRSTGSAISTGNVQIFVW